MKGIRKKGVRKWRVRREAGEWVRQGVRTRAVVLCLGLVFLLGMLACVVLVRSFGVTAVSLPLVVTVLIALTAALVYERRGFRNWIKGAVAERNVGGAIEAALMSPCCAVAHGVYDIPGTIGDIDHLVATPGRLWCVETKYGRVPSGRFNPVLRRIGQNVSALRQWHSGDTPIEGCLVFANPPANTKKTYGVDGVEIRCFGADEFYREIKRHATMTAPKGAESLARRIWKVSGTQAKDG